ncbi:MAG: ABC transporter ATP-binding protein [candidate division Zixibacteria bacterium]|jgi:ABC-2 type transport system ATP-binding protein|nr:ABC transporter ATP-binding protein [candidate division Zixibacteria bacterium]
MIRVTGLRKQFPGLIAVDDVSFDIPAGETFGLLGPNGAGKTTTIGMIVGVLKPDHGTVTIDGVDDSTKPTVRKSIGNSPQALALYDDLTAVENLRFFGRLYGLSGRVLSERVTAILDLVGLTERRLDRVKTFSGGMQRRLNLGCALVHDPPILLLDEPTVGVDPQSRNLIFEKIEELKKQGRTIVYTTHYMEEAQRLCDRVAIIDHGRILALDTVRELIARHGGKAVVAADLNTIPDDRSLLPAPLDGDHLRFETNYPMEDIARLARSGLDFRTLAVDQPDLESVFLNLTGRRLRD